MDGTTEQCSNVINSLTSVIKIYKDKVIKIVKENKKEVIWYNDCLKKYYKTANVLPIIAHEVTVLGRLAEFDIAPKVINFGKDQLTMEPCGEAYKIGMKLNGKKERIEYILDCLKKAKIKHNDLQTRNLLVKDGKLYICDFQLACIGTKSIVAKMNKLSRRADVKDSALKKL